MSTTCEVTVYAYAVATSDYIDRYNENHGKGIAIGMTIWATVSSGYHKDNFKYGKLYQWGRIYGQGYSGEFYDGDWDQTYSDSTVPTFAEAGVSEKGGNNKNNENVFYIGLSDWVYPSNDKLWNSVSEENPKKTGYDPCPTGRRIPTYAELEELQQNYSSWTSEGGQNGLWFSGPNTYSDTAPQVFFPAASDRYDDGSAYSRGNNGHY